MLLVGKRTIPLSVRVQTVNALHGAGVEEVDVGVNFQQLVTNGVDKELHVVAHKQ